MSSIMKQNWIETVPGEELHIAISGEHEAFTLKLQCNGYGAVDVSGVARNGCLRMGISHPAMLGAIDATVTRVKIGQEAHAVDE